MAFVRSLASILFNCRNSLFHRRTSRCDCRRGDCTSVIAVCVTGILFPSTLFFSINIYHNIITICDPIDFLSILDLRPSLTGSRLFIALVTPFPPLSFSALPLLLFQHVQGNQESLFPLFIQHLAHPDELSCILPFVVAGQDMKGVQLKDLVNGICSAYIHACAILRCVHGTPSTFTL